MTEKIMTEKLFRRWKKSELQKELESEGWRWETNVRTGEDHRKKVENLYKSYEEVRTEEAYNIDGALIQDKGVVAIYVRGRKQETA